MVYTVITGDYDAPPKVSETDPDIEWYCFADELSEVPEPWQHIPIADYFVDSKLTSLYLKTNPHILFGADSIAIWVDGNLTDLRIRADDVTQLVASAPFAAPAHRERSDISSEAKAVADLGLDSSTRTAGLLSELRRVGYPDDCGLSATMFLVRDLSKIEVRRADDLWWDAVARLSRRDQLSFNYALWAAGTSWNALDVDYRIPNEYFTLRAHRNPTGRRLAPGTEDEHPPGIDAAWMSIRRPRLPTDYPSIVPWHRENWDIQTIELLSKLNAVVERTQEPLEGNYCHYHRSEIRKRTPPDVRRSWKREFLRQASSGCHSALEVGFNAGHSAAILLGSNPYLNLLSVDIGEHAYSRPCADAIATAYPGRFSSAWGDSGKALLKLSLEYTTSLDFVHLDGGHGEATFSGDLQWFLCEAVPTGCLLLVDDVYAGPIGTAVAHACESGFLQEVVPGLVSSGENRLYRKEASRTSSSRVQ